MSTTLGVIDIIAESEHILVKFIYILECDLDFYAFAPTLKIYGFMKDYKMIEVPEA